MHHSPERQRHWYVLYSRIQYTRRIADAIRRESGHCFLPMQVEERKWSDRVKLVESPLFLNYIFVQATQEERLSYLEFEGALHYVSSAGRPVVVRTQVMEQLAALTAAGTGARREPYLTTGDRVVVATGAFQGIEGVLIRKLQGSRLVVRIPLLKQSVSVELSEQDLFRAEAAVLT